jgi:putative DNA primase/helicase
MATAGKAQRFTRARPCPICKGADDSRRGEGERCFGFLSTDGKWAHCTREEHAGQAKYHPNSSTWSHRLNGKCLCGTEHGPAEPSTTPKTRPVIDRAYDYRGADGTLIFQAVRLKPKGFRQRQPNGKGGWEWNLKGIEPTLYRLPELLAADPSATVYICEGEKDCDRLVTWGLVATTNPMGAGKWRDAYSEFLRGRDVVILADNDKPGRDHSQAVAASAAPVARSVRVAEFPELAEGGDVSDWLNRGHTLEDLKRRAEAAPLWSPVEPPPTIPIRAPEADDLAPVNCTDTGNAMRLVKRFGEILRYVPKWGVWLWWDGMRWKEDTTGEIYRLATRTVQGIGAEAAAIEDDDKRRALLKWAIQSEDRKRIESTIALARFRMGIPVEPHQLDADRWLLNVRNGTLDLHTGKLRPHRQCDLITKLAPVTFDPEARCPKWDASLARSMGGDESLVGFLRRAGGYGLTADVGEHCLFFLYGDGRNGKSTWLDTIQGLLGDYATTINASLLTTKAHDDHPTEKCDLDGRRFVATVEVEDGKQMAEALVKSLTGGDRIKARRMRHDFYEFAPTFKLYLAANHKPEIRGTDEGIWSRIKLVPFRVTIPKGERIKNFSEKLQSEEGPGILNHLIQGCLEWQRDGLAEPEAVTSATEEYRAEMDTIGDFFSERCVLIDEVRCKANDLYAAYKEWSESSGGRPLSGRKFGARLNARGFKHADSNGTRWRLGIGLRATDSSQQPY